MALIMENQESKYIRARERVEELKKYYRHLSSYVFVIAGIAALNYGIDQWSYMWFLWAALGWGIGIFFHTINTFNMNPFFGKAWEKRKIEELMNQDQDQDKWN